MEPTRDNEPATKTGFQRLTRAKRGAWTRPKGGYKNPEMEQSDIVRSNRHIRSLIAPGRNGNADRGDPRPDGAVQHPGRDEEQSENEEEEPPLRTRDEEEEESPRIGLGGIGMANAQHFTSSTTSSTTPIPSTPPPQLNSRGGIGSSSAPRAGIGIGFSAAASTLPSSFGTSSEPRPRRSFLPQSQSSFAPSTPTYLSRDDRTAFAKAEGSFGAKLMAKMGWSAVCLATLMLSIK